MQCIPGYCSGDQLRKATPGEPREGHCHGLAGKAFREVRAPGYKWQCLEKGVLHRSANRSKRTIRGNTSKAQPRHAA